MGGLRAYVDELRALAAAYDEFSKEAEFEAYEDARIWIERLKTLAAFVECDAQEDFIAQNIEFGRMYLQYLIDGD